MTPDEIQKDREAGTPETHEPDYKAAMLYHSDRADAYMSERDALTAENAAMKERVAELEAALKPFARRADAYDPAEDDDWMVDWYDSGDRPTLGSFRRARAALEKSHE